MIQSVNPTPTDETDGLPMPRRIWAVISVGFALCMSVLDVNIINIVLPTLSHDFGTSPRRDYLDYQRLPVGNRCFSIVFFRFGGDYRLSKSISFGDWVILYHFTDLRPVRFILDIDDRPHFSRIQRFGYYKCEHGAVTIYLSEKPARTRNGN